MIKKVLCSLALVSLFSLPAAAQDVRATSPVPAMTDRVLVPPSPGKFILPMSSPESSTQPSYCNPCLFYGGDLDPTAANAQGFANENTQPSIGLAATTYPAVHVPSGIKGWEVTGLVTNNQSNNGGVLDPNQATWSISKNVSTGNAGTTIASGTATASVGPTGRSVFGFTEYWVSVTFSPVRLNPGGNYWISVVPQCTNANDPACGSAEFFLSNTNQLNAYPAPIVGHTGLGFFNSSYFGFDYAPLCTVSLNGCQYSSFGVIGTSH
jgi:hypothetical protein